MIQYFNPGHETAILVGSKYYTPRANAVSMQADLAYLAAYYSSRDDLIFIHNRLPRSFRKFLAKKFNINTPAFTKEDIPAMINELSGQEVCLWGISPHSLYLFESLSEKYELNLHLPEWSDKYLYFTGRQFSAECLKYITDQSGTFSEISLPVFFTTLIDIEEYISAHPSDIFVAKAPYSSSGKGLLWLPPKELTRTERQILQGHLNKQGTVSLEKALDKKVDFAMEFACTVNSVNYLGLSLFKTNEKGAYIANVLKSQEDIQQELYRFIARDTLDEAKNWVSAFLLKEISPYYTGYIGIDMMIYEENGTCKLQPCVEINVRNNMGIVSLHIMNKIVSADSQGHFYIDFSSQEEFIHKNHLEMHVQYPPVFQDNKLVSGYVSLCPVSRKTKYRAYLLVERK